MEFSVNVNILGFSLLLMTGSALATQAKEPDPATLANSAVQMDPSFHVPPGVALAELHRLHNARLHTHTSRLNMGHDWEKDGWRIEGTLGFVSVTPFENSALIWECWGPSPYDLFTSRDSNCEGQNVPPGQGPVGYISTVQTAGTVPLYRCVYVWQKKLRHYDSPRADCEGNAEARNDGPLGYVFM